MFLSSRDEAEVESSSKMSGPFEQGLGSGEQQQLSEPDTDTVVTRHKHLSRSCLPR